MGHAAATLGGPRRQRLADPAIIDRDARFLWLANPSDCPKGALGFDFDGAAFTHVGGRVTFETLMASFGLEQDPALVRITAHCFQRRRLNIRSRASRVARAKAMSTG